jgi:2-dehydro-3-deoxyphosphogluconate aldolase/(4S)-4-hydroxy-2-oxoglutarate aldolase
MRKSEVRTQIAGVGIIPAVRVSTPERAQFAAEAVYRAGIPIAEITLTVPKALEVISHLAYSLPDMIVGAGTILDKESARRCVDAGARFLTSPGLVLEVVEYAVRNDVVVFPGALTPTEVIAAWKAGADFVKIYPCAQVGGHKYIQSLKTPLPQIPLIATGGVNQKTAMSFLMAGASALGIGAELIPREALSSQHEAQIHELARRYKNIVSAARKELSRL